MLALVVVLDSAVTAEPALPPAPPPLAFPVPPPPKPWAISADLGVSIGARGDTIATGLLASFAIELGPIPLWLHAMAGSGQTTMLFSTGSGNYSDARVGLQTGLCDRHGHACVLAGLDVGREHYDWSGTTGILTSTEENESVTHVVLVPRIVAEAGNREVRVRAAFEVLNDVARNHVDGGDLTLGVAVGWL